MEVWWKENPQILPNIQLFWPMRCGKEKCRSKFNVRRKHIQTNTNIGRSNYMNSCSTEAISLEYSKKHIDLSSLRKLKWTSFCSACHRDLLSSSMTLFDKEMHDSTFSPMDFTNKELLHHTKQHIHSISIQQFFSGKKSIWNWPIRTEAKNVDDITSHFRTLKWLRNGLL